MIWTQLFTLLRLLTEPGSAAALRVLLAAMVAAFGIVYAPRK